MFEVDYPHTLARLCPVWRGCTQFRAIKGWNGCPPLRQGMAEQNPNRSAGKEMRNGIVLGRSIHNEWLEASG